VVSDEDMRRQLAANVGRDYRKYVLSGDTMSNGPTIPETNTTPRTARRPLTPEERDILESGGVRFGDALGHTRDELIHHQIQQIQDELRTMIQQALTLNEVAQRLSVSKEAALQLLTKKHPGLHAFKAPNGVLLFPGWQFTEQGLLPDLQRILKHIDPKVSALTINRFMTSKHCDLPLDNRCLSPQEWLASGHEPVEVERLARDISGQI